MTEKADENLFFGLHLKFGWHFCEAEIPSHNFLDEEFFSSLTIDFFVLFNCGLKIQPGMVYSKKLGRANCRG